MILPQSRIGVGIDTGRYGHRATFLRPDREQAARPLDFPESVDGYRQLASVLERLQVRHADCQVHVHIDAAGQYASNLERFLRQLDPPVSVSVGEPKRNKDYHAAVSPKRKTDSTESLAMARFAVAEQPQATAGQSAEFLALREITSRLKVKARDLTRATNRLHNLLSRTFPELATVVPDVSAGWVLSLLKKYPTAEKIARAHASTLTRIPYATQSKIQVVQQAASQSVGSFRGAAAESLIKLAVEEVDQVSKQRKQLEKLLEMAFRQLPESGHVQLTTINGIGTATAAVLTSKIVAIERFEHVEKLVGYFGIFPREVSSGVDKAGNPKPSKTQRMSHQGNDLARGYLYSAAKAAVRCNPAIRALYRRLRARGKRTDVALGHCMRKLLHLVFAVWTTNKPFDPEHYPWEEGQVAQPAEAEASPAAAPSTDAGKKDTGKEKAAGRKRDISSQRSAVTAATDSVESDGPAVNSTNPKRPFVDFADIRSQVSMRQILEHLDLLKSLRPSGGELRGPCPLHASSQSNRPRHFAVNLDKNVFRCFSCQAQGNQLDFWAALHQMSTYDAALDLIKTFHLNSTG